MEFRIVLFLVSISCICLLPPVTGDEALIEKVCTATPEKDACLVCLMSTQGSKNDDESELASLSINCAIDLSYSVIQDLAGISNRTGDSDVRKVCEFCQNTTLEAAVILEKSVLDWNDCKFRVAGDKVTTAINYYLNCSNLARNIPSPPIVFIEDFSYLKKYYLNARAMLYNLPSENNCQG